MKVSDKQSGHLVYEILFLFMIPRKRLLSYILFIYFKIGKNNLLFSELCRGSPLVWVLQSPPHLPFFPVTLARRENHKLEFKKALTIPGFFHRQEESRGSGQSSLPLLQKQCLSLQ